VVHNIGAQATGRFTVRATSGGKTLWDRRDVASLDAPTDLHPRRTEYRLENLREHERQAVLIELDPGDAIPEITEANNRVELVPALVASPNP
jgi:hypothetical protein